MKASYTTIEALFSLLKNLKIRFFLAGFINTIFGYFIGIFIYKFLNFYLNIIFISILLSIINITFSFCVYKFVVFRSPGNWFKEYIRCYVVYGTNIALGIPLLWFFVDHLLLPFWIAQAIQIFLLAIFSYIGHRKFTFKTKRIKSVIPIPKNGGF